MPKSIIEAQYDFDFNSWQHTNMQFIKEHEGKEVWFLPDTGQFIVSLGKHQTYKRTKLRDIEKLIEGQLNAIPALRVMNSTSWYYHVDEKIMVQRIERNGEIRDIHNNKFSEYEVFVYDEQVLGELKELTAQFDVLNKKRQAIRGKLVKFTKEVFNAAQKATTVQLDTAETTAAE